MKSSCSPCKNKHGGQGDGRNCIFLIGRMSVSSKLAIFFTEEFIIDIPICNKMDNRIIINKSITIDSCFYLYGYEIRFSLPIILRRREKGKKEEEERVCLL